MHKLILMSLSLLPATGCTATARGKAINIAELEYPERLSVITGTMLKPPAWAKISTAACWTEASRRV